jgi:hypothetical protein
MAACSAPPAACAPKYYGRRSNTLLKGGSSTYWECGSNPPVWDCDENMNCEWRPDIVVTGGGGSGLTGAAGLRSSPGSGNADSATRGGSTLRGCWGASDGGRYVCRSHLGTSTSETFDPPKRSKEEEHKRRCEFNAASKSGFGVATATTFGGFIKGGLGRAMGYVGLGVWYYDGIIEVDDYIEGC